MWYGNACRPSRVMVAIGGLCISLLAIAGTAAAQEPLPLYVAGSTDFQPAPGGKVRYSPGPGQTVLLTPGINAFTTFEAAVGVANANDNSRNTIVIGPGTFDLGVAGVLVTKDLKVIGAGPAATTLRATTSLVDEFLGMINVLRGISAQFTQFAIDGRAPADPAAQSPVDVYNGIVFANAGSLLTKGTGLVDHLAVRSIRAAAFGGVGVAVELADVTVSQSTFANIGHIGIAFARFGSSNPTGAVLGNSYAGQNAASTNDVGVSMGGNAVVTIEGNTFVDVRGQVAGPLGTAAAVFIHNTAHIFPSTTAFIRRNTFANNIIAIAVGTHALDASDVTITENNITGLMAGVSEAISSPRGPTHTFGAPNNFWGGPLGPFNAVNNPGGDVGQRVSDAVTPLTPFATEPFPLTFTPPPASIASLLGTIGGTVTRSDTNAPQVGATAFLDVNGNSALDEGEVAATTSATGAYAFTNLPIPQAGTTYTVVLVPGALAAVQNPQTATITPAGQAATVNFVLTPLASTTTVLAAPNPVQPGQTALLAATVAPEGATGTVTFSIDGIAVAAAPLIGGQATVNVSASTLSAGAHELVAAYNGSGTYAASISVPVPLTVGETASFTQHFAEGATGFFQTGIGLLNASATDPAHVTVSLLPERGATVLVPLTMDPLTRQTIDLNAILGDVAGVSASIDADRPIAATRRMAWGTPVYGSMLESGIATASPTWYFAEGATSVFSLFFLIENPGSVPAHVTFTHLLEGGAAPVTHSTVVSAFARRTIFINAVPGLSDAALSTSIASTVPIVAERAMYLNTTARLWEGGTVGRGATALAASWSFAEGATGFFRTYLLLGNPNPGATTAVVRYQLTDGTTFEMSYPIVGQSRRTIDVALEDARMASTAVAISVDSSLPIVAERAMWWGDPWTEGSVALGTTETGTVFGIGEGAEGGPHAESTFVLISNASASAGTVRLTVVYDDGTRERKEYGLDARARLTVRIAEHFALAPGRRFSVLVESLTSGVPITVESATYQSANSFLDAGGAALATKIR